MEKIQRLPEAQLIAYEDAKLADFAKRIKDSGISLYEFEQACGISWETAKAAASAIPVRHSAWSRIEYYLKLKNKWK